MAGPNRSLLITDGGVAGLLACATASERNRRETPIAWVPGTADAVAQTERVRAVQRQSELYQFEVVTASGPQPETTRDAGEIEVRMLVDAAFTASGRGLESVVWPVTAGSTEPDLDRISQATDRALLAARLVSIGMDRPVKVETPYVDLTNRQLADLVLDMELPLWLCWWADSASPAAAAEREQWQIALRAAGWEGGMPAVSVKVRSTQVPGVPGKGR